MKNALKTILSMTFLTALTVGYCGCGWLRATGDSVEAVGEGAAHALDETGHAVSRAADQTEDEIDQAVH